ncbi:site-specific tyrosine recombinase/integron integrase [Clostridium aestuarii]
MQDKNMPKRVREFLSYIISIKGKSENTAKAYKYDLKLLFKFLRLYREEIVEETEINDIDIKNIDDDFIKKVDLSELYSFITFVEKYRNNSNYSKARKVATMKSFFKYLNVKIKLINENPALELETPKIGKRNPIYLNFEESKSLLKCIDGTHKERDYCIITLFLNCGLRLSELCGIKISDIKDNKLTVIGKGNKQRVIYLNLACIKSLESYLKVRKEKENKILDKDILFISQKNTKINKRTVERMVKKYIEKAGIEKEKFSPHKLRHTAATLMYKNGADIRGLQKFLGHENISTTQIYTHVDDERMKEIVNINPLSSIE